MTLTEFLTGIANAIRGKTGETGSIPASSFAEKISAITTGVDTSDATAAAGDILSGKTAYVNGTKVTGTIASKTESNLSASGAAVTVPAGYYPNQVSKSVATATQATPSISVDSAGKITASATQSAGYVASGTKSATKQLTTQAAQTITPGTSDKTISSGRYLTGTQTIKGDSNLVASNIKSGVSIFGVSGTAEVGGNTWIDVTVTNDTNSPIYAVSGSGCYRIYVADELPVGVRNKDLLGIFFVDAARSHMYSSNRLSLHQAIKNESDSSVVGYIFTIQNGTGDVYFRVET